ncbi:MAG: AMP-binding protein [Betaproteobacteria bacterium]|nr:AMP-binding protein [Betaproteobacteria bacterium]
MNAAADLLAIGVEDSIALECGERRLSYGELRNAVCRSAGAWRQLGLQADERVLVFAPDGIDWVVAYLGSIAAGGVAVGLNSRLFEKELGIILNESGARFIWCEADSLPLLTRICNTLQNAPKIVVGGDQASPWQLLLDSAASLKPVPRTAEDMALWIYTSGTTGRPKAVIHAQRVAENCALLGRQVLGLSSADRLYASSKLFFAYPLANSLFAGLRLGATVILDGEWPTAERVAEICERHHPTVLFSVPTLYRKLAQGDTPGRLIAAGVRHFVSAGESLPLSVRRELQQATGVSPLSGYGTSETMSLMLYCQDDSGLLRPTPRTEVREDIGSAAADTGLPRRLWLRHPSVAIGYWQRPAEQHDFSEGWFSPGDMFLPHAENIWEFSGRTDDMLKISGQWVSTIAVDQALLSACGDSVQDLGSAAIQNEQGLTELAVFVVASVGCEEAANARLTAGIAALPGFKRPRRICFVDQLPRTATGKLQRNRLASMISEQGSA